MVSTVYLILSCILILREIVVNTDERLDECLVLFPVVFFMEGQA